MDEIFGKENFRNEIILNRGAAKAGLFSQFNEIKSIAVAYDNLYWYSKHENVRYKQFLKAASKEQKEKGKWTGFDKGEAYNRPTMRYEILGINLAVGQWKWEKNRAYKAVENYQEYFKNYRNMSLEDYWINTGRKLEFIRKNKNGKIQYWVHPRDFVLIDNNWLDLTGYSSTTEFQTENSEYPIKRIIDHITSNKDDLVMDFFLGSGTTTAVAHKLGRKWLGVEMGEHFYSVVLPRMKKVLAYDKSGISKEKDVKEKYNKNNAGGFFKYYELEQYEEALANCKYEDGDLFNSPSKTPYQEYVFMKDEKMLECLEIDYENNKVKVDLDKLYQNIDIAETLSNLTGKWITKITDSEVEFEDEMKINTKDLDYKLIKPLIWWE